MKNFNMKRPFFSFIKYGLLSASILTAGIPVNTSAQDLPSLKDVYKEYFLVGAALNEAQFTEKAATEADIVKAQFNSISPENVLKWGMIHPVKGKYDFSEADKYVEFGEKNHMFIIGHTLVWHHQTPGWVFKDDNGNPVSRDTLLARMKDHIFTVVGRYKGRIKGWDVVNEALNEDGTLRETNWMKIIGKDYLVKAFEYAHEADPDAELYYNDYSLVNPEKLKGAVELIKYLQENGVKVAGVGLQAHYTLDFPSDKELDNAITRFAETGVGSVNFTELDINVLPTPYGGGTANLDLNIEANKKYNPYPDGAPDSLQNALAAKYAGLFKIFIKHKDVVNRVTFWGVTDRNSWLNGWPIRGRTNYPLLFDREGKPKPAFYSVIDLLKK